ncbi:MAG: hypothetical protein WDZ83_16135 [Rhizobiaceae bacterium]
MRDFLVGVLDAYAARSESVLSLTKLGNYLTARYGTIADAKAKLGDVAGIRKAFVDLQRELYAN